MTKLKPEKPDEKPCPESPFDPNWPATNLWWGYQHVNDTYRVKRYFGPMDIREAIESNFVAEVAGPIPATDRQDAVNQIVNIIKIRLGI